jgi:NADH-quinone oxidoreductase subunit C
METTAQIVDRLKARFPGASIALVPNPSPAAQESILVDAAHGAEIAAFLRDDDSLALDFCSNATGVDWLDRDVPVVTKETVKADDGTEKVVETKSTRKEPGYLEAVYHLYSMRLKHGPVVLRMRSADRSAGAVLPSLTPVWRSCEFQEREIFDLYGVTFTGHPDLRRILMWDELETHPMRKDYVEPDDYEWEPTPHDEVLEKTKAHSQKSESPEGLPAIVPHGGTKEGASQ